MTITTEELEKLLARAEKGPWVTQEKGSHPHPYVCGADVDTEFGKDRFVVCYLVGAEIKANGELISAAPDLARELLAARKVVEAVRQAYVEMANKPYSGSSYNAFYLLHRSIPAYDQARNPSEGER